MSQSAENARQFDRTALMTWPSLAVTLNLLPWHWWLLPRGWYDYSPRGERHAGWWGANGSWLFIEVAFGFNLPLFDSPWTRIIPPAKTAPTPCATCTDPAELTDCRSDTGEQCGPCHIADCAECQDVMADEDAARARTDGRAP